MIEALVAACRSLRSCSDFGNFMISRRSSIRTWEVSHSGLDLIVGKLPRFLDNRHVPDLLTWLIEDFASLAGRFDGRRE
jgi:hypothetical protein